MTTPIQQCRWILTYTVAYSRHEQTTQAVFVSTDAEVLHRFSVALCDTLSTLIGFTLTENPAYDPKAIPADQIAQLKARVAALEADDDDGGSLGPYGR